jgi:hypothetical protein
MFTTFTKDRLKRTSGLIAHESVSVDELRATVFLLGGLLLRLDSLYCSVLP